MIPTMSQGIFEGMAAWVLHMVIVIYRSLGPGGFCSLSSTTSPRGPRISLSIASLSSSSMPAYDSSVLSLYFRIPSMSCSSRKVTGIIGGFSVNISVRPDGRCQFHGCLQFLDHWTAMTLDQHRHLHES